MKIAVIPNMQKERAPEYTKKICDCLFALDVEVMVHIAYREQLEGARVAFCEDEAHMIRQADMILTVGGDGTIIRAARHAVAAGKPLLGVNCGRLGFMAGLEIEEINGLEKLVTGEYGIEQRMLLDVTANKADRQFHCYALNDAVISKDTLPHMIDVDVDYNGRRLCSYRADGLILATPTGSTAYSLSAGGPVVDPQTNCILLTPICPHTLFSRPILFGESGVIRVSCKKEQRSDIRVAIDGEYVLGLERDDYVEVKKAKKSLQLVQIKDQLFYDMLTTKFAERR